MTIHKALFLTVFLFSCVPLTAASLLRAKVAPRVASIAVAHCSLNILCQSDSKIEHNDIHLAIENCDIENVKRILRENPPAIYAEIDWKLTEEYYKSRNELPWYLAYNEWNYTWIFTPLFHAVGTRNYDMIQLILAHVVQMKNLSVSALAESKRAQHIQQSLKDYLTAPLALAASTGDEAIMNLLIEHGADVNGELSSTDNVLKRALKGGHTSAVTKLIALGADQKKHPHAKHS